jgi:pilus assembly protein CpaF
LVCGNPNVGKTTLLAALLALVPSHERIVIVEDSRELAPNHAHVVRIEGRPANTELAGAVTLTDLVRQSLRMRPDRLVVGEVRGAEICDLLTAMNTGHEGGCGTVHANSTADVPARLEALASLGGLPQAALHAQLASALDAVIHVARGPAGLRRIAEISIFVRDPASGLVRTECALEFHPGGRTVLGPGSSRLERMLERC